MPKSQLQVTDAKRKHSHEWRLWDNRVTSVGEIEWICLTLTCRIHRVDDVWTNAAAYFDCDGNPIRVDENELPITGGKP